MPDVFTNHGPTIQQTPGGMTRPPVGVPTGPVVGPGVSAPPTASPDAGGGIDWAKWLGLGLNAAGSLYGAYSQNQANGSNTAAQMAQLAMLNGRQAQVTAGANSMMQQGQNPYSSLIMQMLSGAHPSQLFGTPGQFNPGQQIPYIPGNYSPMPIQGLPTQLTPGVRPPGGTVITDPKLLTPIEGGYGQRPDGSWEVNRQPIDPDWANYFRSPGVPSEGQNRNYSTVDPTTGTPSNPVPQVFQNGQWVNTPGPVDPANWNFGSQSQLPAALAQSRSSGLTPMGPSLSVVPSDIGQIIPDPATGGGGVWQGGNGQTPSGGSVAAANPIQQLLQLPAFTSPSAIGTQSMNPGQDPYLQMMRANTGVQNDIMGTGNPFDTTALFGALDTKNNMDLTKQLADMSGSYGSFGQRMGSASMNAQSNLRSTFLTNANAQRQQLAMQAYTDAQNRRLSALGIGAGREAQIGSQQLAQQGQQLGAQQFNATQQQNWNQFMLGGLTQANSMQQAQQGQNMGLLSLIAGLPMGQPAVSQPSAMGGAMGDIGQLLMMYNLLGGA